MYAALVHCRKDKGGFVSTPVKKRLPPWAKKKLGHPSAIHRMKALLRERNLHTVCESARCPNMGECFGRSTATFLILGDVCTRSCGFCSVERRGGPRPLDAAEPSNVAGAAAELSLSHVVVTSVTRDDLADGGAAQFALTIKELKAKISGISVEVLTPDFNGDPAALETVLAAGPEIFNHNIETVPSLYPVVRPQARYSRSMEVLARAARAGVRTKSGIMVGLGERPEEVRAVLMDLKDAGCAIVTIGQYLRPTKKSLEVVEYVTPETFAEYAAYGAGVGIEHVYSAPFVRSSYNAEVFAE